MYAMFPLDGFFKVITYIVILNLRKKGDPPRVCSPGPEPVHRFTRVVFPLCGDYVVSAAVKHLPMVYFSGKGIKGPGAEG
jgi:hypothetical protein